SDAARLQSSDHVTQTGTCIQLQAAANPHQEAHWIAQRVVAWQRKHASPVRIAIAFSHITQQAYALQHVLHEYGVRCVLSRGLPLTQSPCMQFVVHVLRARQQGVPVHMVSALLAHPAYKMQIDAQKASQLQAMLAQTGVGHDTNMAQDSTGAFLRYLKQRSKHKDASLTMQIPFQETTACLEPLLKMLYAIPLQESLQNYLQHVVWLLQEHIVPSQDDCHAEVLALIKDLLRVWCTLSKHDEAASSHVLSLEDFVTWLHAHVQQHHISSKAVVDDALVEIVSTKQLWARQVDYVVLASLQHSNAAEHHRTKTLFNERHMSILRTVLGKEVLADPVAFDALWFAGAVLSAKKGLLVSAYLHDEQGKSVLPSTLFQRLCVACNKQFRQLGDVNIRFDRPLSDLQYQYESAQHALQQNHFQRVEKTASHEGIDTPVPCLSKKQWDQARLFACMQQQRQDFFAHAAPPASFAFAVGAHDLHGRFDKLGLRADGPLTPSRIEALAQCPFRFFVERLLQVHLPQQELRFSGLQTGQLAHRVLQRFYEQQAHTAESLQLEQIQNIVRQLVHECSKPWLEQAYEHEKPLWQGFCMWLQTAISQLIVRQVKHPPIHGVKPRHMELVVGSGEKCKFAPVPVNVNGKTIFLAGVLDRVDFGKQMCVVVDYKMSSQTQLSGKMAPSSLLRFHFQLPIYQRLVSHHFPQQSQGQLLGYLLSIRDGTPSTVLGGQRHLHWKERVQQDDRSDSLAAALKTVLQPIYDGNVPACVGPVCQHCCLQHACRRPAG
ncbi:MAG: PD-(D/E)XK nuclease family protein, partial [Myxococcota bacterium]